MEIKTFNTFVKKGVNPVYDDNDFVEGRLSGIQQAICDPDNERGYAIAHVQDGYIIATTCTLEQYERFAEIVEKCYPKLCVFDYKDFE